MVSLIQTIRPENFWDEVISEPKIVLLLCMPHDDAFPRQQRVLEEIAGIYRERIKVVLPEEAFIEVFKYRKIIDYILKYEAKLSITPKDF